MIDRKALSILNELKRVNRARFSDLLTSVRNARTLSTKLKHLKSLGLIEASESYYHLTEKGEIVASYLSKAEEILKGSIKINVDRVPEVFASVLKKYCELLYEKLGDRLRAVVLFGSMTRGVWDRNSDIDLLVVVDGWDRPSWERTKELIEVRNRLRRTKEYEEVLEKGYFPIIQNYALSTDEAKDIHRIYLDASVEGIILYEKEGFATKLFQSIRDKLKAMGATRVQLPSGGHYWLLS